MTQKGLPKRVWITGGASGIGLATALKLARTGVEVVLLDKDEAGLTGAQDAVSGEGGRVRIVPVDLTDPAALAAAVEATGDAEGLVNCAGIYPVTPSLDMSVEEWDRVLSLNLRAPFLMTRSFAKKLIARKEGGAIVNISSTASVLARPGIAHYGASKAALNQLTRVLAVELAPHSIRVNAVLPGVIETETVKSSLTTPESLAEMAAKTARIPMGRLGTPDEIADLVVFLLSDAAAYSTGGLFTADGGFSLGIARY
ncbi:MAG: SDR family NAD(P)-dependent oxidoreductase [Hyphomicrobiaceae bacterium]